MRRKRKEEEEVKFTVIQIHLYNAAAAFGILRYNTQDVYQSRYWAERALHKTHISLFVMLEKNDLHRCPESKGSMAGASLAAGLTSCRSSLARSVGSGLHSCESHSCELEARSVICASRGLRPTTTRILT